MHYNPFQFTGFCYDWRVLTIIQGNRFKYEENGGSPNEWIVRAKVYGEIRIEKISIYMN